MLSPGNDDAIRAIKLVCGKMADAIAEVKQGGVGRPKSSLAIRSRLNTFPDGMDKPDVDKHG